MTRNDYLLELSLLDFSSPVVKRVVLDTPLVSFSEFLERMEPCDVLVSFPKSFKSPFAKFRSQILAITQRVPISSAKMVLDKRHIVGYGVKPGEAHTVRIASSRDWLTRTSDAILVRIPTLTERQKKVIVSFMKSYVGKGYSNSLLFKSIWNRISRRKFLELAKIPKEQLAKIDLYCSSLIAVAFWISKIPVRLAKHPLDVWPKDFILSPYTEKVCRYSKH